MRFWVALLFLVCLILHHSEAVALSRYGRSDGIPAPGRRAVLSRYGRAVLSRYGKRSGTLGDGDGKTSDSGEFLLCKFTGVLNYVECLPSSEGKVAM